MNLNILLDTSLCLSVLKMSWKGAGKEKEIDLAGRYSWYYYPQLSILIDSTHITSLQVLHSFASDLSVWHFLLNI